MLNSNVERDTIIASAFSRALEEFRSAWAALEIDGKCDAMYGAQYTRISYSYLFGSNFKSARECILYEANRLSQEEPNNG